MTTNAATTRNSVAFGLSALFHVLLAFILLFQESGPYVLPTPPSPPVEVEIERIPEPITIPPPIPREVQPPTPTRPLATPPVPAPTRATKIRPIATVQSTRPAPVAVRPLAAQSFTPLSTPQFTPTPAPQTERLNVHKAEKKAPAGSPTLPMAPSPTPSAQPAGGGAPIGGSRLRGLTPYGPGGMPTGGLGLRGSLVGCANANAVDLSSVERAKCNERFGEDMADAPRLDGIAPGKRAGFDKRAQDQNAWKAYRDGAPPTGTTRGANGFGGLGQDQPDALRDQIFHPH